ncbi:MAG: hypothetical protein R3E66_12280 [bacterium]
MIPDYLIYDELKRRREEAEWEPQPLHLPLYSPEILEAPRYEEDDTTPDSDSDRGVVIIDMNHGWDPED